MQPDIVENTWLVNLKKNYQLPRKKKILLIGQGSLT